jgi:hypothetical protein
VTALYAAHSVPLTPFIRLPVPVSNRRVHSPRCLIARLRPASSFAFFGSGMTRVRYSFRRSFVSWTFAMA